MRRKYRKPPIVEVVCEFVVKEHPNWDFTLPGLVFDEVRDDYPLKESRLLQQVMVTENAPEPAPKFKGEKLAVLLREDRLSSIQLGDHRLIISCLSPYPGWEVFSPRIERAFDVLVDKLPNLSFKRIGLRYINRIEYPDDLTSVEGAFCFHPSYGNELSSPTDSWIVGAVFNTEHEKACCKVQLMTSSADRPDYNSFILDLDYSINPADHIAHEDAMNWLSIGHDETSKIFEACIGEPLRGVFEVVGNE